MVTIMRKSGQLVIPNYVFVPAILILVGLGAAAVLAIIKAINNLSVKTETNVEVESGSIAIKMTEKTDLEITEDLTIQGPGVIVKEGLTVKGNMTYQQHVSDSEHKKETKRIEEEHETHRVTIIASVAGVVVIVLAGVCMGLVCVYANRRSTIKTKRVSKKPSQPPVEANDVYTDVERPRVTYRYLGQSPRVQFPGLKNMDLDAIVPYHQPKKSKSKQAKKKLSTDNLDRLVEMGFDVKRSYNTLKRESNFEKALEEMIGKNEFTPKIVPNGNSGGCRIDIVPEDCEDPLADDPVEEMNEESVEESDSDSEI